MKRVETLSGKNLPRLAVAKAGWPALHMPDDMVVVRNRDGDEAGDYRLARHGDVAGDPNWESPISTRTIWTSHAL